MQNNIFGKNPVLSNNNKVFIEKYDNINISSPNYLYREKNR